MITVKGHSIIKNGGWEVHFSLADGKKTRYLINEEKPYPKYPESIDLKITDECNAGCRYCHENSTAFGKHGDADAILKNLEALPAGTEIAIGGGNPMVWPHLNKFLFEAKNRGWICNVTVNGLHIKGAAEKLRQYQDYEMIYGIGISAPSRSVVIEDLEDLGLKHVVVHLICYYTDFDYTKYNARQLDVSHFLILGYKTFGRGNGLMMRLSSEKYDLDDKVRRFLNWAAFNNIKVSFDNLALEQANVRGLVGDPVYNKLYMGPDGMFTMYVDGVKGEFAVSSTTPRNQRVSWDSTSIVDYFAKATRNAAN